MTNDCSVFSENKEITAKLPNAKRLFHRLLGRTIYRVCLSFYVWHSMAGWLCQAKNLLGSLPPCGSADFTLTYSPITWNTISRCRSRVSHSTSVRFCHGPTVIRPSINGTVINGLSRADLIWLEPLSSCHVL